MNLNMILLKELKVGWYIELIKRKFVELLDFIKYSIKYNQLHAKRKINLNILLITGGIILMNACVSDGAGEHFKLKKEVTLSDGRPHGLTINTSSDNGYVIAGSIASSLAWAARVDSQGKELWRYLIPKDERPEGRDLPTSWHASQYKSAVILKNGNTLLCGHKETGDDYRTMGLVTRIDRKGQFMDQQLLSPRSGDNLAKLNYIDQCGAWGDDGYFLAGWVAKDHQNLPNKSPKFGNGSFFWLIALDAEGNVKWEKLIDKEFSVSSGKLPWQIMKSGDLVFSGAAPSIEIMNGLLPVTGVIRIDKNGEVKAQRNITGVMQLVRQPESSSAIRLVPINLNESGMFLLTLNDDLTDKTIIQITTKVEFSLNQAVELQDHSILLVGHSDFRNPYATLIHFSPDLHQSSNYIFKPKRQAWWVDDVVLTGISGEVATVRSVFNDNRRTETKNMLSFIKIQ